MRKKYEVARFVLDAAETERLCRYLEIDDAAALTYWQTVVVELAQHLDVEVDVEGFAVPDAFQVRLHDCLVFLVNRIESAKHTEVMGDAMRPTQVTPGDLDEMPEEHGFVSDDVVSTTSEAPAGPTRPPDGPLHVERVLDELTLPDAMTEESIDKRP